MTSNGRGAQVKDARHRLVQISALLLVFSIVFVCVSVINPTSKSVLDALQSNPDAVVSARERLAILQDEFDAERSTMFNFFKLPNFA